MKQAENIADFARKKLYINTNLLISDNNLIEIENCKKILEYNDVYLKIMTSNLIIEIWGKDLKINNYGTDGIVISGQIGSIEFAKRSGWHKNV